MFLPDVCSIQIGYTARSRLETDACGVLAIQLRDVTECGVDVDQLARVQVEKGFHRYEVRSGDVLFRSRGDRNIAIALDDKLVEPAVAVSPLMSLRPMHSVLFPEYLAWIMNQSVAQRHFDTAARGTSIRMVPKSCLDDLQIDVPDLETQRRIVMIDALAKKEATLMRHLVEKKSSLTNLQLAECARRGAQTVNPKRIAK